MLIEPALCGGTSDRSAMAILAVTSLQYDEVMDHHEKTGSQAGICADDDNDDDDFEVRPQPADLRGRVLRLLPDRR